MSRRLLLDNGPAHLLTIERPDEDDLRRRSRDALEQFIIHRFPSHKLHVPIAAAAEVISYEPIERPHNLAWFNDARRSVLPLDVSGVERSQGLADLLNALENFYIEQQIKESFLAKYRQTNFVSTNALARAFQERLKQLLDSDLEKRLVRLYALQDLQIAIGRMSAGSEAIAAFQVLDALHRSGFIDDFPSVLRLAAGVVEINRALFFKEVRQNEFDLKHKRDNLDCEIATCLILGSHSGDEHHPLDVLTFEETAAMLGRALAVRVLVVGWNKFLKRNFADAGRSRPLFKLRQGKAYFCELRDQAPFVTIRRIFEASDIREGGLPRL